MASIEKASQKITNTSIGKETSEFIFKKWFSVLPESIITWLLALVFSAIANQWNMKQTIWIFIDKWWEMIFLSMTGIGGSGINLVVWYISSMLLCMAILYPLLRKYHDITIHVLIPVSALLILGYLSTNYVHPRNPLKWLGFVYKGTLRAFAEIGIGVLLYYFSKRLRSYSLNKWGCFLLTCIEWSIYLVVIYYMYSQNSNKYKCDFFFLALLACAVSLSFSEKGIDNQLFANKLAYTLGRFSTPLFFSHVFYAYHLNKILPQNYSEKTRLSIYLIISVITAYFVMRFCKWLRYIIPDIKRTFKKLFLYEDTI